MAMCIYGRFSISTSIIDIYPGTKWKMDDSSLLSWNQIKGSDESECLIVVCLGYIQETVHNMYLCFTFNASHVLYLQEFILVIIYLSV